MHLRAILDFLDAPVAAAWDLTPEEAVAFLQSKGLAQSFDWRDLVGAEHARAFTVAKMMDADLLATVKDSLDDALAKGIPFQEWADGIIPTLQAKGWWGRKQVTDPLTGETIVAGLGSPARLQTIYRTNMQAAYAAGAWDAIEANADLAPFLLYDAIDDHRTRPDHAAWDGTVLPVSHDWWATHYPPNGWNCRCSVIQLSEEELADLGMAVSADPPTSTVAWTNPRTGKTRKVPKGVDPGWDYNVGAERAKLLAQTVADKLKGYPPGFSQAAAAGLAKAQEAGAKLAAEVAQGQKALAKEMGSAALKRATMKAAERSAQWQLDDALAKNTPHLAKAIQKVQATKAGQAMGPQQLLETAKAQAAKAKQSADLAHWKQAKLAGKKPGTAAQAAFDALPEDAAAALAAQVDQQLAAKALQQAAQAELDAIGAKGAATLEAKALAKALASPELQDALPTELLAAVKLDVAAAKAKQVAAQVEAGLKKALISEKLPTPAQIAHLKAMDSDKLAAFLKEVEDAKQAKLAAAAKPDVAAPAATQVTAPAAELDTAKMIQVGPQRGSNPGGLYRDPDTGDTWYIKTPASAEHARNEVLAARLYQLAGADVPELRLTTLDGKPAVASRIVDGLEKTTPDQLAKAAGVADHFVTDAWLGNWDVVGATFDNLLLKAGKAVRVDTGGALRFRAQGGAKGAAWGDTVAELDSLRQAATNPQAAKVFGKVTSAQMKAGAQRLVNLDRGAIDALVDEFGPLDAAERAALKATLRARLDNIGQQLDVKPDAVPVPAPVLRPGGKSVTAQDFDRIVESRANGYTISTDGGDIEDHQVLLQHYTGTDGKARTRLVAKLRGDGAARALAKLEPVAGVGAGIDLGEARAAALALAKSINSRAAKGAAWDDTITQRLATWRQTVDKVLERSEALDADTAAGIRALVEVNRQVRAWESMVSRTGPLQAIVKLDVDAMADVKLAPKAASGKTPAGIPWAQERNFTYQVATFDRGHMTETAQANHLPAVNRVLVGEGDGTRVRFIPDTSDNSISSRGLVHIDVDGADLAAAERAIATLADLGVTTTRTTQGQRLGLYLDKLANLRGLKDANLRAAWAKLDAMPDEAARNAAKLELLNKEVGYDLTRSPHWNPEGLYQAFGHGRTLQMRPDLDGPEMAAFERDHLVYTNVTGLGVGADGNQWERLLRAIDGGGTLSSQMDRARRGIASTGSSVHADHNSGGANYVFTRLVSNTTKAAGVYFKPRIVRRVDAFSYDGDVFGTVDPNVQRQRRAIDPAGFKRNASNYGNETNFRDGISLFDDLERIVFRTKAEQAQAIKDMKARGYRTWPDGRPLEEVLQGPKP